MLNDVQQYHWYSAGWWTAVSGAGQLVAALVAAWAAILAKRSAKAAEGAVGIAQQSLKQTEKAAQYRDRCYLALEDTRGPKTVYANTQITMTFEYRNVGATPAYAVEFGSKIILDDVRRPENTLREGIEVWHPLGTVAPSQKVTAHCDGLPSGLGLSNLERLMRAEGVLVIISIVKYTDVFGVQHETNAAYEFHRDVRSFALATYFNTMT